MSDSSKKRPWYVNCLFALGAFFFLIIVIALASGPSSTDSNQDTKDSKTTANKDVQYVTKEGTPERYAENDLIALLDEKTNMKEQRFQSIKLDGSALTIDYTADSNLSDKLTQRGIWTDTVAVVKEFSTQSELDLDEITINASLQLVDQYGNESLGKVMTVTFTRTTWEKINWDNFITDNLPSVADEYWVNPAIN